MKRLVTVVLLTLGLLCVAGPASAHPLGNFTVNRYTGILVSPDGLLLDHVVDLAEIPTAQLGSRLHDLHRLGAEECASIRTQLQVDVDADPVPLSLQTSSATTRPGQGGLPITRISCRFAADTPLSGATSRVSFVDRSAPGAIGWREVTAIGSEMSLVRSDVPVTSASDRLRHYPSDLLTSPLSVDAAHLTVRPGGPPASLPDTGSAPTQRPAAGLVGTTSKLLDDGGAFAAMVAVLLALVVGASHALAPGHGKTVMAFYLSQRGGPGDGSPRRASLGSALAVGATVTASHTGSVLALGVLVSFSTQVVPSELYPWLSLVTGLLILGLGLSLVSSSRRARLAGHEHGHGHGHGQGHGHGHGHAREHTHRHDDLAPAPRGAATLVLDPPRAETAIGTPAVVGPSRRAGLWVMGLVGGLVPSPSALLLLLAAVALGRAWLGVVLVIAFGVGMACTLAGVGILARDLLLRVESLARRRGRLGAHVRRVLSYGAAAGVCAVGVGVILRAMVVI